MATSRRVFLNLVGVGACGTAVNLGCTGFVEDSGLPGAGSGADAASPAGSGGSTGLGGDGMGGQQGQGGQSGQGGQGQGGSTGGAGGAGNPGTGGAPGQRDAGADVQRDAGGGTRDSGTPTPDAGGPVLGPGDIAAGNVSGLAVGALNAISGRTVAIGRDAMGVYALTLICTHQGCTAAPAGATGARQVNCPCHGSQFDRNGAVIRGPAARPLVHFAVQIDAAGNIVIRTNTQVAATVRTAP